MTNEGRLALKSDDVRAALADALRGKASRLAELLARHGGLPGRANMALAAAFGDAVAGEGNAARAVLAALAREEAEADTARAFLPIAAAFGYAARLKSDPRDAWDGVRELAADDRAPVRIGLTEALHAFSARAAGNVDLLVAHAAEWLELDDRDHVYAAQAIALDVVAASRGLQGLENPSALTDWLGRVLEHVGDAPRADERSPARRKLLTALPAALAETASSLREGIPWLTERIADAPHPDLRAMFERAIDELRRGSRAQNAPTLEALRSALTSTKKPPRDPSRIREGTTGRGKKARRRSR